MKLIVKALLSLTLNLLSLFKVVSLVLTEGASSVVLEVGDNAEPLYESLNEGAPYLSSAL